MNNTTTNSPGPHPIKSLRSSGQPNGGQGTGPGTGEKEPQSAYGMQIAQTALQSVGGSDKDFPGTGMGYPEYAAAVSILFTKATNQAIMLGTEPRHVLSTSLLYNSLLHDKRFKRIPMSEAAPGDIIIASTGHQAAEYAGIVVDHGRIVSMGTAGTLQNNQSLAEVQRSRQEMAIFRYIGVQRRPSFPLANAGYNPGEPRLPAGQSGGGQWTTGSAGGEVFETAPSVPILSGVSGATGNLSLKTWPLYTSDGRPSKQFSDGMIKVFSIPKNATLFISPGGQDFYAPENTDFKAIHDVAKSKSPPTEAAAIAQFGLFDFQRNMGRGKQKDNFFYSAYTDASNYAVGVYTHGLGYSLKVMLMHGRTYALTHSSNAGEQRAESLWLKGWDDAEAGSFAKPKVLRK